MSSNPEFSRNAPMTRRGFLIGSGLGTMAAGITACTSRISPANLRAATRPSDEPLAPVASAAAGLTFKLTAQKTDLPIMPGKATQMLTYTGEMVQGDPGALAAVPGSYLGPIVRMTRGDVVRVHIRNELDEPTNVHWHGLIVPAEVDGQPGNLVDPGAEVTYEFEVRNRPGTYWFHPHPHGRTAEQAYHGLAGLVIVSDAAETALGLPSGAQDIPLIIQDRRFDGDNQLIYIDSGMAGMMDQMMGLLGDHILVNGRPDAVLAVSTQPYRLRLLNGSNSRIYKIAWSSGAPLTVLATDGGLLAQPATFPYVMLSPGERIELWADFSQESVGSQFKLISLPFAGVEAGSMDMMMGEPALPNGAAFAIMTFDVTGAATSSATLPAALLPVEALSVAQASNGDAPRPFVLAMDNAMNWTINGRQYEMDVVADDERVNFGDTEVWEFINVMEAPGGMHDFMAHPVHLHGVHFQVVDRQVDAAQRAGWDTVKDGMVDQGWKDTVLVMPGERVRVAMRFDGYRGVYLIHCHNLEHEDGGMMRNFEIT